VFYFQAKPIFRPNLFLSVPLEMILQTNDKIDFALKHSENSEILCVNLFRINNEKKIAAADAIYQACSRLHCLLNVVSATLNSSLIVSCITVTRRIAVQKCYIAVS
jgi:hypothetical protein